MGEAAKAAVPRPYLEVATEDAGQENTDVLNVPSPSDTKARVQASYLEIDTQLEGPPQYPDGTKIILDVTPLSCKSTKSTGSSAEYHQPNQTIIILDWDDTMCPSTACMRHHGLSVLGDPPDGEVAEGLAGIAKEGQLLLEQAFGLAEEVIIVTNAEEGWIDLSCKQWLPGLQSCLDKAHVVSARSTWEPQGVASPAGWKARAFEEAVDKFYSRYPNQSWKNIISIGDAPHEKEALHRVVSLAPGGPGKRCRSKSVKFVLRPSIEQITRELQMLRESLREIVLHDDDLDLHFSAESLSDNV